jgi:hypothetical protein
LAALSFAVGQIATIVNHLRVHFARLTTAARLRFIKPRGTHAMLRITPLDELDRVTLKLEGSLAGIWVAELEGSWRGIYSRLEGRLLYLDMHGVENVDRAGRYLLALLRQRGVQLVTSGTLMTHVVRSIEEDWLVIEHQ